MSVMSNLFLLELCALTACWIAFLMCLRLSTRQPVRVNQSNSIHPRIKKDSPPYTYPYACRRLSCLRDITGARCGDMICGSDLAGGMFSESNRKDNDNL